MKLSLILLIAFIAAAPFKSVVADAAEADVLGTFSVFVDVILIFSKLIPNSFATNCAIFIINPCPISTPP